MEGFINSSVGRRALAAGLLGLLAALGGFGCYSEEPPVEPAIEHIWLEGVSDGSMAPYDSIHVRVTGRGIIGETVVIEAWAASESTGESVLLETWEETVVYLGYYQRADVDFEVAGAILDHADRITLTFRARFEEQVLTSDPILLVVEPTIQAVRVFYEGPSGPTERGDDSTFPITQELTVRVESMGLVDRFLVVEVVHSVDEEETVVDTLEELVESQQQEIAYQLDAALGAGEEGVAIYFNVGVDDLEMASPRVIGTDTGVHSCGWYDDAGHPLGAEARVDDHTPLRLRAYTWGLDGVDATFEVWDEDEMSDDDFAERLVATVEDGLAEVAWVLHGIGDGPLDADNEYYIIVSIGSRSCRSTRIITQ